MSVADDLLNSLGENGPVAYSADASTEEHIVIGNNRQITVPDALKRIAVQYDHNVETVTFDCPRFWDEHDLSKMKVYINYLRPDRVMGMDLAENVSVDEIDPGIMHFTWTITRNVTMVDGTISFLVCVKNTNDAGIESNHWNSELCSVLTISKGLECTDIITEAYPDIITDLLLRMDYVEGVATPESMRNYIMEFLSENPELPDTIKNYIYEYMASHYPTTEDAMAEYVNMYLDKHPFLFAIGPNKPGVSCLWFNTGAGTGPSTTTTFALTGNSENDAVYVETEEGETVTGDNLDII